MIALEEYTAHHSESAEEIMYVWPWRRFEGMFKRHLLRKAREELRQMRDLRMAAMDSNPNFDSKDNQEAKRERTEQLQSAFQDAITVLYGPADQQKAEDPYEDDPLFAPLRNKAESVLDEANAPLVPQAGMGRQLLEATS